MVRWKTRCRFLRGWFKDGSGSVGQFAVDGEGVVEAQVFALDEREA